MGGDGRMYSVPPPLVDVAFKDGRGEKEVRSGPPLPTRTNTRLQHEPGGGSRTPLGAPQLEACLVLLQPFHPLRQHLCPGEAAKGPSVLGVRPSLACKTSFDKFNAPPPNPHKRTADEVRARGPGKKCAYSAAQKKTYTRVHNPSVTGPCHPQFLGCRYCSSGKWWAVGARFCEGRCRRWRASGRGRVGLQGSN